MRLPKEMRVAAKRRNNERALKKDLQRKAGLWMERIERAQKHNDHIPPGGTCYLSRSKVWFDTVQEWILVTAQKLEIPPQFLRVTSPEDKPDLSLKTWPSMEAKIPNNYFKLRGIASENEAQMLLRKHLQGVINATANHFAKVVKDRYFKLGFICQQTAKSPATIE